MSDIIYYTTLLNNSKYYTIEITKYNEYIVHFNKSLSKKDKYKTLKINLSKVNHNYKYIFQIETNDIIDIILFDNSNLKFESFNIYDNIIQYPGEEFSSVTPTLYNIKSKIFHISHDFYSYKLYNCQFDLQY